MDLRIQKTKSAVQAAFLELRQRKPIEKITVTELSHAAEINKATFYLHYSDIYSLADEIEDKVIDDILADIPGISKFNEDPQAHAEELFRAFVNKRSLLNGIFSGSRYSNFANKIEQRIKARLYADSPELRTRKNDVVLTFIIQGTFHTVAGNSPDKSDNGSEEFEIINRITSQIISELK